MKKKLTAIIAGILAVCGFAGCGKVQTSGFNGSYWLDNYANKTAPEGFYEKLEYEITTEKETDFAPMLTTVDKVGFEIDRVNSSYVTELYTENGNYVYETKLVVNGTYYYGPNGEKTYSVVNDTTSTKVVFKDFENNFQVISSTKEASNVFPIYANPTREDQFKKIAYKTIINYSGKDATVTLEPGDPISKEYLSAIKGSVTLKKYNKKAYIDNELIPVVFRSFNYDSSLSYSFNSIENVTGTMKSIVGKARSSKVTTESTSQSPIIPMSIDNCSLNGGISRYKVNFDVMGVSFETTGEFAQTFLTAYYETARKGESGANAQTRHIMVKCYQPMIYSSTYLVYTLHTVYNKRV